MLQSINDTYAAGVKAGKQQAFQRSSGQYCEKRCSWGSG